MFYISLSFGKDCRQSFPKLPTLLYSEKVLVLERGLIYSFYFLDTNGEFLTPTQLMSCEIMFYLSTHKEKENEVYLLHYFLLVDC